MRLLVLIAVLVVVASCAHPPQQQPGVERPVAPRVSGAVVHARVWTGDPARPWAAAVGWADDRIVVVGTDEEVLRAVPPGVTPIDAHGAMAVPGFIDAHVHMIDGGAMLTSVHLHEARSKAELVATVQEYARSVAPGTWITGGGWDHTHWGGMLPDRSWLDAMTPDNPVWIERVDGHMALANSAALRAAGVTRATPDVAGGVIVRDPAGEPTGLFRDNALELVGRAVPPASGPARDRALEAAMTYLAGNGVTSVTSIGSWDDVATFERARDRGVMRTRINAVVPLRTWARLRARIEEKGRGDVWLRVGGLKGFADGSLGARTAWMLSPFSDAEAGVGLSVTPEPELYASVLAADRAGLAVMIHAIGDRANRTVLDVYERVAREDGPRDRRFRIEHAQHLSAVDVPRFGGLGVIASMQPYHCIDDGRWAEAMIGAARAKTSYAFRQLLDTRARVAFGSDWPVAPASPLEGIYAAVTRRTLDDAHPDGWIPEQRISADEALRAYTVGAAYAAFQEADKGTLATGKLADITIVDRDVTTASADSLRAARVVATLVGGRVVYPR